MVLLGGHGHRKTDKKKIFISEIKVNRRRDQVCEQTYRDIIYTSGTKTCDSPHKSSKATMGLKFLNKKGWHTGSLRNIETVWKAEQKRDAEVKKLEELRKQIHEERERFEFRLLQEQAGLIP